MISWQRFFAIFTVAIAIGFYLYPNGVSGSIRIGPTVTTINGKIRGIISNSRAGNNYYQFLGIKYAKPPVGKLRFEAPQPIDKFDLLEAYKLGPECLQFDALILNMVMGQEDCLSLNIYTPKIDETSLLPVLVYIHGGMFHTGSSNMYNGDYFVDENVILVSLNYRLGALGFLSSGVDGVVRGNNGLKDQHLALLWIKTNIRFFGGDPNKITIFGESAGGASTHYHQLSHQSQNLFSKVISMSGTAFYAPTPMSKLNDQFKNFAAKFDCQRDSSEMSLQCLKTIDGKILVQGHQDVSDILSDNEFSKFGPTMEPSDPDKSISFVETDPRDLVETGKFQRVPWISGIVLMEGLLYVARIVKDPHTTAQVNQNWLTVLPKLLRYDPEKTDVTKKIKEFYFGSSSETLDIENNIEKFSGLFSDRAFNQPMFDAAKKQSKYSPVFLYYLTYKPTVSIYDMLTSVRTDSFISPPLQLVFSLASKWFKRSVLSMQLPSYGPCHGDELSLLFNLNFILQVKEGHADFPFSKKLVKLWADLARESVTTFNGHEWSPSNSTVSYMELNSDEIFHQNPQNRLIERMKFWESLNL